MHTQNTRIYINKLKQQQQQKQILKCVFLQFQAKVLKQITCITNICISHKEKNIAISSTGGFFSFLHDE